MKKKHSVSTLNRATPLTDLKFLGAAYCTPCSPKVCSPVLQTGEEPPEPGLELPEYSDLPDTR